jgi:hypothetical protein
MADASQNNPLNPPPPPPIPTSGVVQEVGAPIELSLISESKTGGLEQYPMTDAIRWAGELGMFRNQGLKVFLQTLCHLRETDLKDARVERKAEHEQAERFKEVFFNEKTETAVLRERLRGDLRLKKLQNVFLTIGGILCGAGLQPLLASFSAIYCIVTIVGLVLLLFGWFYPENPKDSQ